MNWKQRKDEKVMEKSDAKKEYEETKKKIERLIKDNPNGPYTHKIISLNLTNLALSAGFYYANNLVEELGLEELYAIWPIDPGILKDNDKKQYKLDSIEDL